jgi:hypothetical protein
MSQVYASQSFKIGMALFCLAQCGTYCWKQLTISSHLPAYVALTA